MARVVMDKDWRAKLEPYVEKFMMKLARDVLMDMHEHCPVHTGFLQSDLAAEVSGYDARIGARTADYAIYVEEGAGPHMIFPNSKGALWWDGLAHPVNMVRHPGSPATHFMRKALYKQRGDI